ncbi:MAG: molybdopterin-dependent oxidoreductase [Candidatus Caldarchaeum sp.]|nr:molybdopterin-dependent oxidoreductase [Candidatus Caldarchaeum sp.]
METRGIVSLYDPEKQLLAIYANTQNPRYLHTQIAYALGIPESRVRVFSPDIGGGFSVKAGAAYDEEFLVAATSYYLKTSVKWSETRREHMQTAGQAREQHHACTIAADRSRKIIALKDKILIDGGATNVFWASWFATCFSLTGPYKIPYVDIDATAVFTNKAPYWACRGFGKYDASVVLERMVDKLARELGLDPLDVRLKNLIPKNELPLKTPTGAVLDSGDYHQAIKRAAELINYRDDGRQAGPGKRRGVGIAFCLEPTGVGSVPGRPGVESIKLVMLPSGEAIVQIGTCDTGQLHKSAIKKVVSEELGVNPKKIRVMDGDTALSTFGLGLISCRFSNYVLPAVFLAAQKARQKLLKIASSVFECSEKDLELSHGFVYTIDNPDKKISIDELVYKAYYEADRLSPDVEPGFEITSHFKPERIGSGNIFATYPYAAHAAVVEVDEETGSFKILKYVAVHDCGVVLDHEIVEGQAHGSIIQGLGGTFLEEVVYDENGNQVTDTFMNYMIPSALESIHELVLERLEKVSPSNPLGVKGAGETNTLAVMPAVAQALENALSDYGISLSETPYKPEKIWRLINLAKARV